MIFSKDNKYKINMESANTTLQNVFAACDKAPNSVPFDKLTLREKLNTCFYDRFIIVTSILLLLTLLLPVGIVPVCKQLDRISTPQKAELVNDYVENDCLYIQVTGDRIQYAQAYLEKIDGTVYPVLSFDPKTGILCFPFVTDMESNIYIPVRDSAPLHLLLTPQ